MTTTIQEIAQDQWLASLENASEQYQGWQTTIETLGQDLGDQRLEQGLPLQGLTLETKGSETGDILIEVGDTPDSFMMHHVRQPKSMQMAEMQPGEEADIRITTEDGLVTLVRLHRPAELPRQT